MCQCHCCLFSYWFWWWSLPHRLWRFWDLERQWLVCHLWSRLADPNNSMKAPRCRVSYKNFAMTKILELTRNCELPDLVSQLWRQLWEQGELGEARGPQLSSSGWLVFTHCFWEMFRRGLVRRRDFGKKEQIASRRDWRGWPGRRWLYAEIF